MGGRTETRTRGSEGKRERRRQKGEVGRTGEYLGRPSATRCSPLQRCQEYKPVGAKLNLSPQLTLSVTAKGNRQRTNGHGIRCTGALGGARWPGHADGRRLEAPAAAPRKERRRRLPVPVLELRKQKFLFAVLAAAVHARATRLSARVRMHPSASVRTLVRTHVRFHANRS